MTFDEFKNNAPSEKNFELKKGKAADVLYIRRQNGNEFPERNVWGYCDGKNSFIKSANNFFLLQLRGNAFYIYGAKNMKPGTTHIPIPGAAISPLPYGGTLQTVGIMYDIKLRFQLALNPYVLDWDTGILY
jgi:hypothetical protein